MPTDRNRSTNLTPLDELIDHTPTPAQLDARRMRDAHASTRCHYIKPSGERCGSPAMRGYDLCYYHDRYQPKPEYRNLPCLEDPHSVQCAIQEVIEDMLRGFLDYKKAALALYGLQTAASNLKQMRLAEKDRREREDQEEACPVLSAQCPAEDVDEEQPGTGHRARGTHLESPRPPQRVTEGLLTKTERDARDAYLPDLDALRAQLGLTANDQRPPTNDALYCKVLDTTPRSGI